MSIENRKKVYDRLVAANELWKDDGALVKEFGKPMPMAKPVEEKKEQVKKKDGR